MNSDPLAHIRIFLENVGWRDVLDIVVVAFLLYQLLTLIRGTQAVQLLVGMGILLVIAVGAQILHLRLLGFIFGNAAQVILIAAVVLFQPELRRALDQVGRLGLLPARWRHATVQLHTIDETVRACSLLSESHCGALVVFERGTGLENIAASGVHLDGEVTAEMLTALFFPKSPLHDGAVIIHKDRLWAAGCVLPLAEATAKVGRIGTRHRAALGLTLESDAVVIIVSDESGAISLARRGDLTRNLDVSRLRTLLVAEFGIEEGHDDMSDSRATSESARLAAESDSA